MFYKLKSSSDCTHGTMSVFVSLVGKTSLITRFMYDSFDNTYQVSTSE